LEHPRHLDDAGAGGHGNSGDPLDLRDPLDIRERTVSERDILVRLALVSPVALLAAWFGVVGPKRSDASKQAGRVTAAQQKLSDAQQQLTAGRQAQAQAAQNRRVLAELRSALPDSAGAAALLRQL